MKMFNRKLVLVISLLAMILYVIMPVNAWDPHNGVSDNATIWSWDCMPNITFNLPYNCATPGECAGYFDIPRVGDTLYWTISPACGVQTEKRYIVRNPGLDSFNTEEHIFASSGSMLLTSDYNLSKPLVIRFSASQPSGVNNGMQTPWTFDYNSCDSFTFYVNQTARAVPVPSPTPTPEPTPIPGDVRSYFITIDAATQATIYDTNIMLFDTYRGTWTNYTSDADGMGYIDTLPYTPINAYATYTEFPDTYVDAQLLGVSAGNSGLDYRISMYPFQSAPAGYVTLYVTTMALQGGTIANAQITAIWNNIQHAGNSGSYGTAIFPVPNNTQVSLTARYQGYLDGTKVINVGAGPTYSTTVYLNSLAYTATPTSTPGPHGTITTSPYGTPGPMGTMPSGYTNNQGQRMLDFLATNGMGLVELCFMVTVLALLGVKLGK